MKDIKLKNWLLAQNWLKRVRDYKFWRRMVVMFCVMSIVGHWIEIVYCTFMDAAFGIVEDDFGVWSNPMSPFPVYGVASLLCFFFLVPLRNRLIEKTDSWSKSLLAFFAIAVLFCLVMELGMGLIFNQPDPVTGEYPLWNNSQLPLSILDQAWLVNDLALGILATFFTWVAIPLFVWGFNKLNRQSQVVANIVSGVVIVIFALLAIFLT